MKKIIQKKLVSKDDLILDIVQRFPEAMELLFDYGLHCIDCPLAGFETIADGAKSHGMKDEEIEKMITEINEELGNRR